MTRYPTPTRPGWFWGKWRIADDGTDRCRACDHRHSNWEDGDLAVEDWAVHEVIENSVDESSPEYLMVGVGGVTHWQSLENFVWGPEVLRPRELT